MRIYIPTFGRPIILAIALALLLGACTSVQRAVVDQGVQKIMAAKDAEALVLKQGVCAMGIGAKNRVLSLAERQHVEGLCGGEDKASIAIEDLRALGSALERLGLEAEP